MTQEDWAKMNKESHYRALQEQDTENRKLIKKLQLERDALKKQLLISGVGNWVRFEDDKPNLNDRYLIVWDNYPPETRTWQKDDEDKDYTGLRWLAIPKWK